MKTDVDRLRAVVEGRLHGRGCGKTFAACHNLAGLLLTVTPGNVIIWRLPEFFWLSHIKPTLAQVLEEYAILKQVTWKNETRMRCLGKDVLFVTTLEQAMGLGRVYIVNDYGEWDWWISWQRWLVWAKWLGGHEIKQGKSIFQNTLSHLELRREYENEWQEKAP